MIKVDKATFCNLFMTYWRWNAPARSSVRPSYLLLFARRLQNNFLAIDHTHHQPAAAAATAPSCPLQAALWRASWLCGDHCSSASKQLQRPHSPATPTPFVFPRSPKAILRKRVVVVGNYWANGDNARRRPLGGAAGAIYSSVCFVWRCKECLRYL